MVKFTRTFLQQLLESILNDESILFEERKNSTLHNTKGFDKKSKDLHQLKTVCYALLDGIPMV